MSSVNSYHSPQRFISGFLASSDDGLSLLIKTWVKAGERGRNKSLCVPAVTSQRRESNTFGCVLLSEAALLLNVVMCNEMKAPDRARDEPMEQIN